MFTYVFQNFIMLKDPAYYECCIGYPNWHLVGISNERTVVRCVGNAIVVGVVIASITHAVVVGVLLSGVGCVRAIVPLALLVLTTQIHIGPGVQITIGAAQFSVTGPTHFALTNIVLQTCSNQSKNIFHVHL